MRKRVITLDNQTRKRIVELLAVRDDLIAVRNEKLSSWAVLCYGLAVGLGFVFLMSIVKTGEFYVALVLLPWILIALIIAWELESEKKSKLVKIKLR